MSDFVVFKTYGSTVEAEMDAGILHDAGIPAIVQSPGQGIFGAGFSGLLAQGVTLLVPEDQLDDASELIDEPDEQ